MVINLGETIFYTVSPNQACENCVILLL